MEIFHHLLYGFGVALTPVNIFYCFVGCFVGTLIGVLPGIGPIATISLLLSLTFKVSSTSAIIMLCGIFYGAMYGGSTSSILVNIPGEAAAVVTCLDGYRMARKGRAGIALGISAIGSFIAGTISTVGLTFFSPALVSLALKFGPPEFFAVMVVGFVVTLFMVGGSMTKAVLMIGLGLFVCTIGMDPVKGTERFTFGTVQLAGGLGLVPIIVGMFGVSELLSTMEETLEREIFATGVSRILPGWEDLKKSVAPILRGTGLGFGVGLLPGGGSIMASFLSYAVERQSSKYPEKVGTGVIEGVAGPEAANNAAVAANMVPLLSLGLPSNAVTALLMGALVIHGVTPGPMLMAQNPDLFWGVIASMYIGNVMLLILNLPLISLWVKLLKVPYWILFPGIFVLCVIGTYSENQNVFDVWVMIGFGLLGYLLKKHHYELGPFVLALVLGPVFEQSLRQSLIMSKGDPSIFITRPLSAGLLILAVALAFVFVLGKRRRKIPESGM